jgi:heme/copper-type cytochrome/quinol oxidase subunit 4
MIPLAVSGTVVIGVAVLFAVLLLTYFLKMEDEDEEFERAEAEAEAKAAEARTSEGPPGTGH